MNNKYKRSKRNNKTNKLKDNKKLFDYHQKDNKNKKGDIIKKKQLKGIPSNFNENYIGTTTKRKNNTKKMKKDIPQESENSLFSFVGEDTQEREKRRKTTILVEEDSENISEISFLDDYKQMQENEIEECQVQRMNKKEKAELKKKERKDSKLILNDEMKQYLGQTNIPLGNVSLDKQMTLQQHMIKDDSLIKKTENKEIVTLKDIPFNQKHYQTYRKPTEYECISRMVIKEDEDIRPNIIFEPRPNVFDGYSDVD